MSTIARVGRCVGCGRFGRLGGAYRDACDECQNGPRRGPRWLELARRVRNESQFAARVRASVPESQRDHFDEIFGRPTRQ